MLTTLQANSRVFANITLVHAPHACC